MFPRLQVLAMALAKTPGIVRCLIPAQILIHLVERANAHCRSGPIRQHVLADEESYDIA